MEILYYYYFISEAKRGLQWMSLGMSQELGIQLCSPMGMA